MYADISTGGWGCSRLGTLVTGGSGIVNARSGTVLVTVKTLMRVEQVLVEGVVSESNDTNENKLCYNVAVVMLI